MALETGTGAAAKQARTVEQIQKAVARYYKMTVKELLERTRRHAVARPRQVAMYLAWRYSQASLPDIGQRFGGFDHTTVLYARDMVIQRMKDDKEFAGEVDFIGWCLTANARR